MSCHSSVHRRRANNTSRDHPSACSSKPSQSLDATRAIGRGQRVRQRPPLLGAPCRNTATKSGVSWLPESTSSIKHKAAALKASSNFLFAGTTDTLWIEMMRAPVDAHVSSRCCTTVDIFGEIVQHNHTITRRNTPAVVASAHRCRGWRARHLLRRSRNPTQCSSSSCAAPSLLQATAQIVSAYKPAQRWSTSGRLEFCDSRDQPVRAALADALPGRDVCLMRCVA